MVEENKDQTIPESKNDVDGNDQQVGFTQEQLDVVVKDRLKHSEAKTTSDLMAQLGIENIGEAKKAIEDAVKLKEDQMSELEKTQSQIAGAEAKAKEAEAKVIEMQIKTDEALLKSAIISKAGNFNDPLDAWQFVDRSKIEKSETGEYTGIEEALKSVMESKPYLIKAKTNDNTGSGTPKRATPKSIAERLLKQNDVPKTADELRQEINMTF